MLFNAWNGQFSIPMMTFVMASGLLWAMARWDYADVTAVVQTLVYTRLSRSSRHGATASESIVLAGFESCIAQKKPQ